MWGSILGSPHFGKPSNRGEGGGEDMNARHVKAALRPIMKNDLKNTMQAMPIGRHG